MYCRSMFAQHVILECSQNINFYWFWNTQKMFPQKIQGKNANILVFTSSITLSKER